MTATIHLGDVQGAVGATQIGRTLMIVTAGNKGEQRLIKLGDNESELVVVTDGNVIVTRLCGAASVPRNHFMSVRTLKTAPLRAIFGVQRNTTITIQ